MLEGLLLDHWRIVEGSLKDRSWLEASLGQRCGDTINFSRQRHVVCNWQDRQWIPGQLVSHRPLKGSCKNHRKRWSWKMVPITRGRHAMRINDPGSKNPERIPFIQAWSIFGTLRDRLGSFGMEFSWVEDLCLFGWFYLLSAGRLVHLSQDRSISAGWRRLVVSLCLIGVSAWTRPRRHRRRFRLINGGSASHPPDAFGSRFIRTATPLPFPTVGFLSSHPASKDPLSIPEDPPPTPPLP